MRRGVMGTARSDGHGAILAAFALADLEAQLGGINVGDFDLHGFADAQAAVINQAQTDPEAGLTQEPEGMLHLLAGEDQRQGRAPPDDQFGKDLPVAAQMFAKEELKRGLADGHGRAGEVLVLAQEQEVLAQLIFRQRGRVALEMIGQAADITHIFLAGGRLEVFEFDKFAELLYRRVINLHRGQRMSSSTHEPKPNSRPAGPPRSGLVQPWAGAGGRARLANVLVFLRFRAAWLSLGALGGTKRTAMNDGETNALTPTLSPRRGRMRRRFVVYPQAA